VPDLHQLTSGQEPEDRDNNIVLTEVERPGHPTEYTVTVLIDRSAVSVGGPFTSLDEAVRQASEAARHYALEPVYLRRERA
jgi:hypothetical protein